MYDMNFFADMSLESKRAKSRLTIIFVSILGIAILLIGLYIGASLFFNNLEKQLARRVDHLSSPEVAKQIEELEALQLEITNLEGTEQALTALSNYLSYSPRLKTAVLDALTEAMPADVVISSISVGQGSISLSATSEQERSPLVFSAALKENPAFADVYLSGISRNTVDTANPDVTQPVVTEPVETEAPEVTDPAPTEPDEQPAGVSGSYSFSISCSIQALTAEEGDAQ